MKIKKIVLLLCVLVLTFSMTACSDGQEKVDFNYTDISILNNSIYLTYNFSQIDEASKIVINNTEGQEVLQTAITNFESANEECGELLGFLAGDGSTISLRQVLEANSQSDEAYQQCLLEMDYEIEEDGANVKATIIAVYEDRNAELSFVYEAAPAQTSVDETTGQIIVPFQIAELTVSPIYTFGEKMGKAGMNTLMGMGTVFVILIFISLIIAQFERISAAIMAASNAISNVATNIKEKRAAKKAASETQTGKEEVSDIASPVETIPATENLMNDSQLVAVITAAIMAAQGAGGNTGSDGLIVRSIKKAKR
ncbi:MAG: OadG family protein [Lachnospiraceae bacterium]|nr:OadG family protein [Lachnospiraceae bacterium]